MSAYSTVSMTRGRAAEIILAGLSDTELETLLDKILSPRLLNCLIVHSPRDEENINYL